MHKPKDHHRHVPLHDGFAYSERFNWFEPQGVPS
ncbi:hypothetical protein CsSME_00028976 [Camellia sinensis var. sinensis]